jgi:hypothetical protein
MSTAFRPKMVRTHCTTTRRTRASLNAPVAGAKISNNTSAAGHSDVDDRQMSPSSHEGHLECEAAHSTPGLPGITAGEREVRPWLEPWILARREDARSDLARRAAGESLMRSMLVVTRHVRREL